MKKILLIFSVLLSLMSFAQIRWMSLNDALEAQKTRPRKILIDFYADWCAPCKMMDKTTYAHPEIAKIINENYYPVKFNAEGNERFTIFGRDFSNSDYKDGRKRNAMHDFARFMNVNSVPAVVFIDEQAMPITMLSGLVTARELEPYLALIADNGYQKIATRQQWDAFQKKFKSKIKD